MLVVIAGLNGWSESANTFGVITPLVLSDLQDKINSFFQRLKHYTLRESKEWKVTSTVLSQVHCCDAWHLAHWCFLRSHSW
jgi:hypothetical protein